MLSYIFWLLLNICCIFVIDYFLFVKGVKGKTRIFALFTGFYSQIIVTQSLLSIGHHLTSSNLYIFNWSLTLILFIYAHRQQTKIKSLKTYSEGYTRLLKNFAQIIVKDTLFTVLLVLFTGTVLWVSFIAALYPATDFDGNSYHLTSVAYAIQNRAFEDVPTSLPWLNGYPKGGEMIVSWGLLLPNKDLLADLSQLPFMLVGVVALYHLALNIGANKKNARYSSLLFLFAPIVINQLKTTYVDVMLCAVFFMSLVYVTNKYLKKLDLVLLGASYAMMISLKYTGVLFVLATLPLLFWRLYEQSGKTIRGHIKQYISRLAWVVVPASAGLFWYVKNWAMYHTPLYPFGVKFMGQSIFPGKTFQEFADGAVASGLPKGYFSRIWFVWTEQKDWYGCLYNYDSNYTGFGPIWLILFIPAIVAAIILGYRKKNYKLLAVMVSMLGLFIVYPSSYYTRYTLFMLGLGIVSFAYVMTHFVSKFKVKLLQVIGIVLSLVVVLTNVGLCNFAPSSLDAQISAFRAHDYRGGITYQNTLGKGYVFAQNILTSGEVIAYDSSPYYIYPLWRADYLNKVIYIPAENIEQWDNELSKNNVSYVFTTIGSKENKWLNDGVIGSLIYKDESNEIYKVK